MAELVTPQGVLLGSPEPLSPQWFMLRRSGITATDLPRILGLSQYGNALSVWMDKRGEGVELGDNEAGYWGRLLESPVAERWAETNDSNIAVVGVLANVDHPWRIASLDFLVDTCPDLDAVGRAAVRNVEGDHPIPMCGLEVKTRSAFTRGRWRDDVPDDVLAQVLWQIVVTGFDHMHVAVLFGGQRLESYRVDREDNEDIIRLLVEEAERVWSAVQAGEKPDVDPTDVLTKILDALYPDRSGEKEISREAAKELLSAWRAAGAAERKAKQDREAARARIVAALDDSEVLVVDGKRFLSYSEKTRAGYTVGTTKYRKVQIIDASAAAGAEE